MASKILYTNERGDSWYLRMRASHWEKKSMIRGLGFSTLPLPGRKGMNVKLVTNGH
jgi:hypothetical protein